MSAADLYAAMLVSWVEDLPAFRARHPNVARLCAEVAANPVVSAVWRRHEM